MENKRTKILTVVSVLLVVVIAFCVWLSDPFRSKDAVKISLDHMTNDPSLGPIAVFYITNKADASICFLPFLADIKVRGSWMRGRDWSNNFCDLDPHMITVMNVPIPTNCEAWRFSVWWYNIDFTENESIRTWLVGNVTQNWWLLIHGKHLQYYDRIHRANTAYSEVFTNK